MRLDRCGRALASARCGLIIFLTDLGSRLGRLRTTVRAMTTWEYATVPLLVHATKQILDTWGADGWELVQVVPGPGGGEQVVAYLKRAT